MEEKAIICEIQRKLDEIEKSEDVKILHCIESGSRAWGFPSPDSDYDVRFFYIRKPEFYLRLDNPRDVIEWEINDVYDINGWDIRKALILLHKSNPTFFEWNNSPLVYRTSPQWKTVKHIISGGPYLVKNGNVYVDLAEEKLLAIGGRNPRTAIGYTGDNNLIILTADGREGSSIGMTLTELANLMKSLGCVNAINLDGGGSTVMYVNGQIVNQPPQTGGIALSNAIVISKKL